MGLTAESARKLVEAINANAIVNVSSLNLRSVLNMTNLLNQLP
jgi:hypothetical protein